MVAVFVLPHAELGRNDHREDAPRFILPDHKADLKSERIHRNVPMFQFQNHLQSITNKTR